MSEPATDLTNEEIDNLLRVGNDLVARYPDDALPETRLTLRLVAEIHRLREEAATLRGEVSAMVTHTEECVALIRKAEAEADRLRSDDWLLAAAREIAPGLEGTAYSGYSAEEIAADLMETLRKHRDAK